jgi:hypothetical protein
VQIPADKDGWTQIDDMKFVKQDHSVSSNGHLQFPPESMK